MPLDDIMPDLGSPPQSQTPDNENEDHKGENEIKGQDVSVAVLYTLYVPKPPRQGCGGKMIQVAPFCYKQPKGCLIKMHTLFASLDKVQHKIAELMNNQTANLGNLVLANLNSESPKIKWTIAVSNGVTGVFSHSNNMILDTPGIFKEWKDEL
ncbi:hypothetical protein PtA15_7A43 [Puccinia triticina]|uniref:Uncharacterized protein n=1 Tax=Puccinia triticina TaxID=208348 RepID=A0ABY7CPB4_9BASI|nr:uncharacterized protein PtA15_7A43 [Puccinia triticina]WAQ86317.1 hypothetical protein PtA15_7A43 [Puccinia triticina]WAR56194.1 hypothetical protein PtB15_7B39 [Puccinia triticina]